MDPNIMGMTLSELGRFIVGRCGDTDAARIGMSSAPQLRYDAVVWSLVRDPARRRDFSQDELVTLAKRIGEPVLRSAALGALGAVN